MRKDYSVEDCLEFMTGLALVPGHSWKSNPFSLFKENEKVLTSIGRQVFRGKALTEKQHELIKKLMLEWYVDQFAEQGIDIKSCVDTIREPYREVDKSHWVRKIVKDGEEFVGIRFPFNNSVIEHIADIKKGGEGYHYDKHCHYFAYNEINIYKVVTIALKFKQEFEIQDQVQEAYNQIVHFDMNQGDYVPGIYNLKYKNLNPKLQEHLENTFGNPTKENILELWDKRRLYGLEHFDDIHFRVSTLTQKIMKRDNASVVVSNKTWTINQLFDSIGEMNRYPLMILLNQDTAIEELNAVYQATKGYISNKDISVHFRLDNKRYGEFNQFIRDKGLNNSIGSNTKIVIANRKKITKPILKSNWKPICMLAFGNSRLSGTIVNSYSFQFDLRLFYCEEDSMISQYTRTRVSNYNLGVCRV